jgi:hypothetical protein
MVSGLHRRQFAVAPFARIVAVLHPARMATKKTAKPTPEAKAEKPKPAASTAKPKPAKTSDAAAAPPAPNREERRRAKFGRAGNTKAKTNEPWPESEANPAFGRAGEERDAHTGRPDQDVTKLAGPGTGGATEGAERVIDREGIHGSNTQKG